MPDDDQRKRKGRPTLDPHDTSASVCLVLPSKQFDQLDAEARRERVSLPELIRRRLREKRTEVE